MRILLLLKFVQQMMMRIVPPAAGSRPGQLGDHSIPRGTVECASQRKVSDWDIALATPQIKPDLLNEKPGCEAGLIEKYIYKAGNVGTRERFIPSVCPIGNTGTSQIFVPAK
jgi:hypothetical protein